ncbi:MAG: caspase family protein [Gallionella sp.]|nr:caspase family protein [Gallionella sp.]MDD4946529.1 caspase family protein [Gallionella sp.]
MKRSMLLLISTFLVMCLFAAGPAVAGVSRVKVAEANQQAIQQEVQQLGGLYSRLSAIKAQKGNGKVYALLIGNNHYANLAPSLEMRGPHNDVELIKAALLARGVQEQDITQLKDATYQLTVQSLDALLDKVGSGDEVLFEFSGHAAQQPSRFRRTGLETVLLPSDVGHWNDEHQEIENTLPSNLLAAYFTAIRNRGASLTLLLDICHGGGLGLSAPVRESTWKMQVGKGTEVINGVFLSTRAGAMAAYIASGEDETTPEQRLPVGKPDRKTYSVFTYYFAQALMAEGKVSNRAIALSIAAQYEGPNSVVGGMVHPLFEMTDPDGQFLGLEKKTAGDAGMKVSSFSETSPPDGAAGETRGAGRSGQYAEISGSITRRDGLFQFSVNGIPTSVRGDGTYRVKLPVTMGKNDVNLMAIYENPFKVVSNTVSVEFKPEGVGRAGNSYALIIANQDYTDTSWPKLETPLWDAKELAQLLSEKYGFKTSMQMPDGKAVSLLLNNASKTAILETLHKLRAGVGVNDQLLIFYAGHGAVEGKFGFWVPVDANAGDYTWVSSNDITMQLGQMQAKHILIVSDSCYSGTLLRDKNQAESLRGKTIEQLDSRLSRELLSSGGNEPVADKGGKGHSVFARAFLEALRGRKSTQFTVSDVYAEIREMTSGNAQQIPQYSIIRDSGHDGGAFVFTARD